MQQHGARLGQVRALPRVNAALQQRDLLLVPLFLVDCRGNFLIFSEQQKTEKKREIAAMKFTTQNWVGVGGLRGKIGYLHVIPSLVNAAVVFVVGWGVFQQLFQEQWILHYTLRY